MSEGIDWGGLLLGMGEKAAEAIIEAVTKYIMASAEEREKMRAEANADTLRAYDLVDKKILDNNAKIDALADAKFGSTGVMVTPDGPVELANRLAEATKK
jgi:hypothetical protein